jgi:hypothetical protein
MKRIRRFRAFEFPDELLGDVYFCGQPWLLYEIRDKVIYRNYNKK